MVPSLCWPTDWASNRPYVVLFVRWDRNGGGISYTRKSHGFEWARDCFSLLRWTLCLLCWDEHGVKKGFVCCPAENRRARVKLNDLSSILEKRVKMRKRRINPQWCTGLWGLCGKMRLEKNSFTGPEDHESYVWWRGVCNPSQGFTVSASALEKDANNCMQMSGK